MDSAPFYQPVLHSVSYAGVWPGHSFLSVDAFLEKAVELGYSHVALVAKRPHVSPLEYDDTARQKLRRRLSEQGLRLPLLGDDDETANREYTRRFVLDRDAEVGNKFGLKYAEAYHYIGPEPAKVEEFIKTNAVRL